MVVLILAAGARADERATVVWRETEPYGAGGEVSFRVSHIAGSVVVETDDLILGRVAAAYELVSGNEVVGTGSLCGEAVEVPIPSGARWLRVRPGGVMAEGCVPVATTGTITMSYSRAREAPYVAQLTEPVEIARGVSDARMTIEGIGFNQETSVTTSGSGVSVRLVRAHDDGFQTRMDVVVSVGHMAELGERDLLVSNGEAMTATCLRCVRVNPPPAMDAVSPAQGPRSRGTAVTILGTGFSAGAAPNVFVSASGHKLWTGDIIVGSVHVVDSTRITANFNVQPHAIPGARTVMIRNRDGGLATCEACFTITAA